ncbi:hypothetical protein IIA15_01880 [candidate division TA06 bacterium]|nr:hypothetical protein [candidate division TA06 bacterium]
MKKQKSLQRDYPEEYKILKKLNTPWKIQDFLDDLPYNTIGNTCYSPVKVIKNQTADCFEGAIFAGAALYVNGHDPLIVDLVADPQKDDDHVLAVCKINGLWGAMAKSKFTGLKFRDPVYKNIRELVISYFDDYFNEQGEKTLERYSNEPLNLKRFGMRWLFSEDIRFISEFMVKREKTRAYEKVIPNSPKIRLRKADPLLLKAGMLGYPRKKN